MVKDRRDQVTAYVSMTAMTTAVTPARAADAAELAAVAAQTFPLACPPAVDADDVAAFIDGRLSEQCFAEYLRDPERTVLTARYDGRIVGYAMLIREPDGVELSKMYVLPDCHSTGVADALMQSGIDWAAQAGAQSVWLGVNQKNVRAQRFYRRHGFEVAGTRTFQLGTVTEADFVMTRPL